MGLKVEIFAGLCVVFCYVEIRPRWDWKSINLSYDEKTNEYVEIRPRWDWKTAIER